MDTIEVAQRRQQDDIDHALAGRAPQMAGRTTCAKLDCGAPILPVRQQMGAQLCLACQHDAERESQRCARGAV